MDQAVDVRFEVPEKKDKKHDKKDSESDGKDG